MRTGARLFISVFGCVWLSLGAESPVLAETTCGKPFVPSKRVAGTRVTLPGSNVSLVLPTGWVVRPTTSADGQRAFLVEGSPAGPNGLVALAGTDAEPEKSLQQVAQETGNSLAGAELAKVVEVRAFSLASSCGLLLVLRAKTFEGYVSVLRRGSWTYALAAKYPLAAASAMRAGLDTMVASVVLGAAPQAAPAPAASAYLGCWEASADEHTQRRIQLRADASYTWVTVISGLPYPVEPKEENGRYGIQGETLTTASNGATSTYAITLAGGVLRLAGDRYVPCS